MARSLQSRRDRRLETRRLAMKIDGSCHCGAITLRGRDRSGAATHLPLHRLPEADRLGFPRDGARRRKPISGSPPGTPKIYVRRPTAARNGRRRSAPNAARRSTRPRSATAQSATACASARSASARNSPGAAGLAAIGAALGTGRFDDLETHDGAGLKAMPAVTLAGHLTLLARRIC